MRTEPIIIADILDQTRKLTLLYLKRLEGKDWHHRFEIDGKKFNSVYWEVAHITWAESMLVLYYLNDKTTCPRWVNQFGIMTNADAVSEFPPIPELMQTMKLVHDRALELIRNMDATTLEEPKLVKATNWNTDLRHVLYHAIRHEGTHAGHLSWLIKLHGEKLV